MRLKFVYGFILMSILSAISIRVHAQDYGEEGGGGDGTIWLPEVVITAPAPTPPPPPPDIEPPPPNIPTPPDPCANPCACYPAACSGYNPPSNPPPSTPPQTTPPVRGDHHVDSTKTPKTGVNAQILNFCVYQTIENIVAYFGGTTQSGTIALTAAQQITGPTGGTNEISGGFNGTNAQMTTLANTYLNTEPCNSIQGAINAGDPVMAYIAVNNNTGYHEVMITGYNNNGTYVYFDPQTTQYVTAPAGTVFNGQLQVTGKK